MLAAWRELLRPPSREPLNVKQMAGPRCGAPYRDRPVLARDPDKTNGRLDRSDRRQARLPPRYSGDRGEGETLSGRGLVAEIHGLDQLLPPHEGSLHLLWMRMERVPEAEDDRGRAGRAAAGTSSAAPPVSTRALTELGWRPELPANRSASNFASGACSPSPTTSRRLTSDPAPGARRVIPGVRNVRYEIVLDTPCPSIKRRSTSSSRRSRPLRGLVERPGASFGALLAAGGMAAEGVRNLLGRPKLEPLELLVREAIQNSWDAKIDGPDPMRVEVALTELTSDQRRTLIRAAMPLPDPPPGLPLADQLATERLRVSTIADRGTVGLVGLHRPKPAAEGEPTDFVYFVRNIGQPPDREFGAGSFGYGKGAFYLLSRASTIIVHTHCGLGHGGGSTESRLIACALGDHYDDPPPNARKPPGGTGGARSSMRLSTR